MPVTRELAPGVRLHRLRTARFATTYCRVLLARDLGAEAAATAVLAAVMESAAERWPTRRALAERLADLYGATLRVGVGRLGQRQVLSAALEWPTSRALGGGAGVEAGLEVLGQVWRCPVGAAGGALDPGLVATEVRNHRRLLEAARDDKPAYALRRAVELSTPGEAFARDPNGTLEQLAAVTPAGLAALHARLLRTAPLDVYLVGDVDGREAERLVRRHLLPARAARPRRPPPVVNLGEAPARPRVRHEADAIAQARAVLTWRGRVRPDASAGAAAEVLASVLGGGPWSRLFKVVREELGLCYHAEAGWWPAAGLLVVQTGVDPAAEPAARRAIQRLAAEVFQGRLDPEAVHALGAAAERQVDQLRDSPRALLGWQLSREALGLVPDPARWLADLRAVGPPAVRAVGRRLRPAARFVLGPRAPRRGT